jgi:hypothetical protein
MDIWYTWLGYLGLIGGLVVAAIFEWPAMRTGLAGLAGGVALVTLINVVQPTPATCLQNSKQWDILRAYSLKCPDPLTDMLRQKPR